MAVLKGHIKALDANDTHYIREALRSSFKAMFPYFSCDFVDEGNGDFLTDSSEIQRVLGRRDLDSAIIIYFWIPVTSPKVLRETDMCINISKVVSSVAKKDGLQPLKCYRITDGGNDSWVKYGIALTLIK